MKFDCNKKVLMVALLAGEIDKLSCNCTEKHFGPGCKEECHACQTCESEFGICLSCNKGFYGDRCENRCWYPCVQCTIDGEYCLECSNTYILQNDVYCVCPNKTHNHGFEYNSCEPCPTNCLNSTCRSNGECFVCKPHYAGPFCSNRKGKTDDSVWVFLTGAIVLIIFCICCGFTNQASKTKEKKKVKHERLEKEKKDGKVSVASKHRKQTVQHVNLGAQTTPELSSNKKETSVRFDFSEMSKSQGDKSIRSLKKRATPKDVDIVITKDEDIEPTTATQAFLKTINAMMTKLPDVRTEETSQTTEARLPEETTKENEQKEQNPLDSEKSTQEKDLVKDSFV